MADMPPLVDPSAGYPPGFGENHRRGTPWPSDPSGVLWRANTEPEPDPSSSWYPPQAYGFPVVSTPQQTMAMPQFTAVPMATMPVWPQGFSTPAVMTTPMFIPTNPIRDNAQGEEWVHVEREGGWSGGQKKWEDTPRPRSRSASHRAPSPFSPESSPSSRSSNSIGRSRSYNQRIREDDKRPPREWRTDFSMTKPSALGAALGSLLTPKRPRSSSFKEAGSPFKSTLHPWLRHSQPPHMSLDLRTNPVNLRFRELDRSINEWDLVRFTCEPPVSSMRIFNDHYPWYIEVVSSNPTGVTMHDLFLAIWKSTQTPIQNEDFWNCEMDEHTRSLIEKAYDERCGDDDQERSRGVRRVDFLMGRVKLEGFTRTKDGLYEMKVKK